MGFPREDTIFGQVFKEIPIALGQMAATTLLSMGYWSRSGVDVGYLAIDYWEK